MACPPAPNPSPTRRIDPGPSGAGVFFFHRREGGFHAAVSWNKGGGRDFSGLTLFPRWAGVGAGSADLSHVDETRRLYCCRHSGRGEACLAPTNSVSGGDLAHHEVVAVHHGRAAAEAQDSDNVG